MIKNMHQYRVTQRRIKDFTRALKELEAREIDESDERSQLIQRMEVDSVRTQLADLHEEVDRFEHLKAGTTKPQTMRGIGSIPTVLIETRIARGWTQQQFANVLGVKVQLLQRYEASDFAGCSYTTLLTLGHRLGIEDEASSGSQVGFRFAG